MKSRTSYLLIFSILFGTKVAANDTLVVENAIVDSLLHSSENDFEVLFYKHIGNALINNSGTFGSKYYVPTTFHLNSSGLQKMGTDFPKSWMNIVRSKPLTNVKYINASRKEQLFSILYMQNFGKHMNLQFKLDRVSSPGAYANQEVNTSLFEGELKFLSKKEKYSINLFTKLDRNYMEENGGLANPDFFDENLYDNERTYLVNLFQSEAKEISSLFGLNQKFNLFHFGMDSTQGSSVFIGNVFSYESSNRVFYDNDPLSDIYSSVYIDTLVTTDSIYRDNLCTELSFGVESKKIYVALMGKVEFINHEQNWGIDTSYSNVFTGGAFRWKNRSTIFNVESYFGVSGYRSGDIDIRTSLNKSFRTNSLSTNIYYHQNEAQIRDVSYTSNHFYWRNYLFNKQSLTGLKVEYDLKKYQLNLKTELKSIGNLIYLDSSAVANQLNEVVNFASVALQKKFKLWKFRFLTAVIYQYTSNEMQVPLPDVILRQVAYFEKRIFKGALLLQLGAGVSYSTDYYGYAYMPALGRFYVQDHQTIGSYPNLDLFLNTHLKRAQIFLKYEHFNAGSNRSRAYGIPGYPLLNKSLKFGVSWNLFD